jgi:Cu(I)/Ag(I) efflux system membrane protein CusA/SilA
VIAAVKEVGGPSFFALLVIAVGFLPVFTLEGQEGRLFKPLAFTKNFSMAIAAHLGDHTRSGGDALSLLAHG